MKRIITVVLSAILFGVVINFELAASERDPLAVAYVFKKPVFVDMLSEPTSKALAEVVESAVEDQLVNDFGIAVDDSAVIEYLNERHPELLSDASAAQEREQLMALGAALKRVVDGEAAQTVYDEMASQLQMSQELWLALAEQSANQEAVDVIQAQAVQPTDKINEEKVEAAIGLFVRDVLMERACDLEDVQKAILARAQADTPNPIELDSLREDEGTWGYHCNFAYNDWLTNYLSEHVQIKNSAYDDYRQYLRLFAADQDALR